MSGLVARSRHQCQPRVEYHFGCAARHCTGAVLAVRKSSVSSTVDSQESRVRLRAAFCRTCRLDPSADVERLPKLQFVCARTTDASGTLTVFRIPTVIRVAGMDMQAGHLAGDLLSGRQCNVDGNVFGYLIPV